jgi:hypothetical protein
MNTDPSPKRKLSEMISEMAGAFIGVGKTPEEKQSRLTAACSAWNMACGSPEIRRQQLGQYLEGYQRFNPATSPVVVYSMRDARQCDQPISYLTGLRWPQERSPRSIDLPMLRQRASGLARCAAANGLRLSQRGFGARGLVKHLRGS